jgi:hypothetical protein
MKRSNNNPAMNYGKISYGYIPNCRILTTKATKFLTQRSLWRFVPFAINLCVLLTFFPVKVHAADQPTITMQPENATFTKGTTDAKGRFYVNASSTDGGYLTYQWYCVGPVASPYPNPNGTNRLTILGSTKTTITDGSVTNATLTFTTPDASGYYYYWAEITNHKNGTTESIESGIAEAKVVNRTLQAQIVNGGFEEHSGTGAQPIGVIWPRATYPYRWETTHDGRTVSGGDNQRTSNVDYQTNTTWRGGMSNTTGDTYSIELNCYFPSSVYQEIATVPGKIYEWQFQHATRSNVSGKQDATALVIGPAINEENEYGIYDTSETNFWKKGNNTSLNTSPTIETVLSSGTVTTVTDATDQTYNYGTNIYTHFSAVVRALAAEKGTTTSVLGTSDTYRNKPHSVTYKGKKYFVFIASTPYASAFVTYNGAYSVPQGQGTTVFGWVAVSWAGNAIDGNVLNNVAFASGTPVSSTQEVFYTSVAQISAATRAGFAYGIVEMRGSTAIRILNPSVDYNGASIVASALGAGNGWYVPDGSGTVTFRNLTLGKVYRVVGIPTGAVDTSMHVNEHPTYVLDEDYYKDTRIFPVSTGDATKVSNVEIEIIEGVSRVTIKYARSDVEYALLSGDANNPNTSVAVYPWTQGDNVKVVFSNLDLNSYYYIVGRPPGYEEITYAEAAEAYIRIKTPNSTDPSSLDLVKTDVTRPTAASIAVAGTKTTNNYAIVDPETGDIYAVQDGTGGTVTFSGLMADKTYRVMTKAKTVSIWCLKGVRVYPYPPGAFTIDYANELVKSGGGGIPANVQYRIQSASTWIVGDANTWKTGDDSNPVDLGSRTLNNNSRSILDSIGTVNADATLTYRIRPGWDDYEGEAYVSPPQTLTVPKRPAPPARPADYGFDFITEPEKIDVITPLQFAPFGTTAWTPKSAESSWTFGDAGWGTGSVKLAFHARFPSTASSFASSPNHTDTIPARPPAPAVAATSDGVEITISGLYPNKLYQYRKTGDAGWTDVPANTTEIVRLYELDEQYRIRLSATVDAPASFETVIAMPVGIQSVTFLSYPYGSTPVTQQVVITNTSLLDVTGAVVTLSGANASSFTLSGPASVTVGANSTNTSWTLTPKPGLNAGIYAAQLDMTFTWGGSEKSVNAPVSLQVTKADWTSAVVGTLIPSMTTANRLAISVSGAPADALTYYFNTEEVPAGNITVAGNTVTFTGLTHKTAYDIRFIGQEDANHFASSLTPLVIGYTAHETPVFDDVIEIDYYDEEADCKDGYSKNDYTVISGSMGVWSLTNILDTLTAPTFKL